MATYTVTTSNWNSTAFWSGIFESASGHTLDFSGLGAGFTLDSNAFTGIITMSDGATTFTVGEAGVTGTDANFGGTTQLDYFTTISGTQGDDTADGTSADDVLDGNAGDDLFWGGDGADTFYGNSGEDWLIGQAGDDLAYGGADNDNLHGDDGDDRLYGETGDDTLDGGAGADSLYGGAGADLIYGGDGDDNLEGGWEDAAADTIEGHAGNDLIFGYGGGDSLLGGTGDDWIDGGNGGDDLQGGADQDRIVGDLGSDTITGNTGYDILTGGEGADSIDGGNDADQIWGNAGDTIVGGEGGDDNDTLYVSNVDFITYTTAESGTVTFNSGDTLSFTEIEQVVELTPDGVVDGTASADEIGQFYVDADGEWIDNGDAIGESDADSVRAGDGNDAIWSGDGDDTVHGEGGDDEIYLGTGNNVGFGGAGADTIDGNWQNDTISGDDFVATGPNLIVNGSFEDTTGMSSVSYGYADWDGNTPSWTDQNGTRIDYHDDGRGGLNATDGANWMDMEASTGQHNVISQTVAGVSDGQVYVLTFDAADSANGSDGTTADAQLQVIWNGDAVGTIDASDGSWTSYEFHLIGGSGDGSNTLSFAGLGGNDAIGVALDNVQMYEAAEAAGGDADLILGFDGADDLMGGAGNDTIIAGTGNDEVVAGSGDDSVAGDSGADTIYGGTGDDTIDAGADDDIVWSGEGADSILGGQGNDTLDGGAGDDTIDGGDNVDQIFGGQGGDSISGGANNDFILGDGQVYTIGDHASGGGTATTLTVTNSADGPIELWWINGAGGLQFYRTIQPGETYSQATFEDHNWVLRDENGFDLELIEGAPNQTVNYGAEGLNDSIDGGDANDIIYGQFGDDTIDGGNGADLIYGGAGNDSILTGNASDTIYGGTGNDTIDVGLGLDLAYGEEGDDLLIDGTGGPEAATLYGGDGNDTIQSGTGGATASAEYYGDAGDDRFEDRGGTNQTFTGGTGSDTYVVLNGIGNDTVTGGEDVGGTDTDVIDLSAMGEGVTVTYTGDEAGTITDGTSTLTFSEIEQIILTDEADVVDATADPNGVTFDAAGGNDSVIGSAGNDSIDGGAGDDTLRGGDGNDTLTGGDGTNDLHGDAGNDSLVGNSSDGFTNMEGGSGADTLDGSAGTWDIASYYTSSTGVTVDLTDGLAELGGDAQGDVLIGIEQIDGSNLFDDVLIGDAGVTELKGFGGDDTLVLNTAGSGLALGGDGADTVFGGHGDDTLFGGDGNDSLFARDGNDSLYGEAGNDRLEAGGGTNQLVDGGEGDDSLFNGGGDGTAIGGDGDDYIYADSGNDQLFGDSGDDTFDLDDTWGSFGNDTIIGGETGETTGDTLDLSGVSLGTTLDLTYADPEAGTVSDGISTATFSEIETIILSGGRDTILLADGSGSDTVSGFNMTDSGDGTTTDQLDVTSVTDAGGAIVNTGDVVVTDTNGDGSGDAILTFPGGESLTLLGVSPAQLSTPAQLAAIGIPEPDFIVEGTAGADLINTGYTDDPEGDIVDGGDAADGSDDDVIEAGDGNDTVFAGLGDDSVLGGEGDDSLSGQEGNDTIFGGGGNDSIRGNVGDDFLDGGDGNDTIAGGSDADTIVGGLGDDYLIGGIDISGGDGNDTIDVFGSNAVVTGDAGDDLIRLLNNPGTTTVTGGEAAEVNGDTLDMSAATNSLIVDLSNPDPESGTVTDGSDVLTFSEIENLILGGGADTIVLADGAGSNTVSGFNMTDSGDGTTIDQLDVSGVTDAGGAIVNTGDVVVTDTNGDGSGDAILTFPGGESLTLLGVSPAQLSTPAQLAAIGIPEPDFIVEGTASADLIDTGYTGDPEGDRVDALDSASGTNDDIIDAGAGNDTVVAGLGDDLVYGSTGNDSLLGGDGNDTLFGQDGDDTLEGGAGADALDGDDALAGADSISGNAGNDTIIGDGGNDTLLGGADDDQIFAGADDDSVEGGTGNDQLFGEGGNDYLDGAEGADTLFGGLGNDTLLGGNDAFADSLDGGAGNDELSAGDGNDTLLGGDGSDTLFGGGDNDLLEGGSDDDTLDGWTGDDTLTGGLGNDLLIGSDGDDTFAYASGDGLDTISDFNFGNSGTLLDGDTTNNDRIDLGAFYDDIWELTADFNDDGILNQSNDGVGGVDYSDNTSFGSGGLVFAGATGNKSSFTFENTGVVCFTAGTRILTEQGDRPIESLRAGDRIVTRDNGVQVLRWIGQRHIGPADLTAQYKLRPILLSPDLTGSDGPLIVSPQHGVMLDLDGEETLVRAAHLAKLRGGGARVMHGRREVIYVHILFDDHQIVFANGAPSESFFPGPFALGAMESELREEIFDLFPDLHASHAVTAYGPHARRFAHFQHLPEHLHGLKPRVHARTVPVFQPPCPRSKSQGMPRQFRESISASHP
ncbi:Hint domain-containing protein [Marivita sp.]|uniref:Hint domain-containing protein n=1 Tax=Marivita sp. TaxID=2003365 RepID=UPI0025B9E40C|nr:Hint domain-containing protein [Marivita sp.]